MSPVAALPPSPQPLAHHAAALPAVTPATRSYSVVYGDTLSAIAQRHGTTVTTLVQLNHLTDGGNRIFVGQRLLLPAKGTTVTPAPSQKPTTGTGTLQAPRSYTVTVDRLNVRSGPGTGYRIVGALGRGQTVTGRLDRRTGWVSLGNGRWSIGTWLATGGTGTRPTGQTTTVPDPASQTPAQNLAWLRSHPAPSRAELRTMIVSTAQRFGVDPRLALAVAMVESAQDQRQVSYCNAIGTMQVMPSTGAWVAGVLGQNLNLLRAQDNVTAGVYLLKTLTNQARSRDEAVAGYYQGLYGVQTHGMYEDTKVYVSRVNSWIGRA